MEDQQPKPEQGRQLNSVLTLHAESEFEFGSQNPKKSKKFVKPVTLFGIENLKAKTKDPSLRDSLNPFFLFNKKIKGRLDKTDTERGDELIQSMRPHIYDTAYRPLTLQDPLEEYKALGHGTFFYFYGLKMLGFMLLVLALISVIPLVFNTTGGGLDDFNNIPFWLRTTVINCPLLITMSIQPIALVNATYSVSDNVTAIDFDYKSVLLAKAADLYFTDDYISFITYSTFSSSNSYSSTDGATADCSDSLSLLSDGTVCSGSLISNATLNSSTIAASKIQSSSALKSTIKTSSVTNSTVNISESIAGSTCDQATLTSADLSNVYINYTVLSKSVVVNSDIRMSVVDASKINYVQTYASNVNASSITNGVSYATKAYNSTMRNCSTDSADIGNSTLSDSIVSKATVSNVTSKADIVFGSKVIDVMMTDTTLLYSQIRESDLDLFYAINTTVTGVTATGNSTAYYSRIETTILVGSTIQYSSITDSELRNCIVINSTLYNVVLQDEVIYNNKRVKTSDLAIGLMAMGLIGSAEGGHTSRALQANSTTNQQPAINTSTTQNTSKSQPTQPTQSSTGGQAPKENSTPEKTSSSSNYFNPTSTNKINNGSGGNNGGGPTGGPGVNPTGSGAAGGNTNLKTTPRPADTNKDQNPNGGSKNDPNGGPTDGTKDGTLNPNSQQPNDKSQNTQKPLDPNDPSQSREFANYVQFPSNMDFAESDGGDYQEVVSSETSTVYLYENPFVGVTLYYNEVGFTDSLQEYEKKVAYYFSGLKFDKSTQFFVVTLIADICICVVFFGSIVAFKYLMVKKIVEVDSKTMSISKFAIEILDLPEVTIREEDIRSLIGKLSDEKIVEINFAYDFQGVLDHAVEKFELQERLDELHDDQVLDTKQAKKFDEIRKEISLLEADISRKLKGQKLDLNNIGSQFRVVHAYVIFENSSAPRKVFQKFTELKNQKEKTQVSIGGHEVALSFPSDVYTLEFTNAKASKISRFFTILGFIVLIGMTIVGTAYLTLEIENGIENNFTTVNCPDSGSPGRPRSTANYEVKYCYCNDNIDKILTKDYRQFCGDFLYSDNSAYYAPIVVVVVITVLNMVIEYAVSYMFKWVYFMDQSTEVSVKIIVLFLFEFANILVGMLVVSESGASSDSNSKAASIGLSLKFVSPEFYVKTGSKVIMLNFIGIFLPPLLSMLKYYFWRKINDFRAKRAVYHKDYLNYKQQVEFDIEENYITTLTTLATALTFSSAMPVLLILALLSIFVSFWVQRYIFVKFARQPMLYSQTIIRHILMVMPLMIICHLVFSVSVFGDWSIFMDDQGKSIWKDFLLNSVSPNFSDELSYRLKKNSGLITICGSIFLILVVGELVFNFMFYHKTVSTLQMKSDKGEGESYYKSLEKLRFKSAMDYDFRKLPEYLALFDHELHQKRLEDDVEACPLKLDGNLNTTKGHADTESLLFSQLKRNAGPIPVEFKEATQNSTKVHI
jgi:hypothetical protein